MGIKKINDIWIEYDFFQQMASILEGVERKHKHLGFPEYEVKCPKCGKRKAVMRVAKDIRTFMFLCPVDYCRTSLTLNNLIVQSGDRSLLYKWNKATHLTWYDPNEYGWLPIRNRRK